ncbi:hypothetical protein [Nocardiopsis oceani]
MTTSMPPTGKEPEDAEQDRPSWPVIVSVTLLCLAVVASGWGVARLTLVGNGPEAAAENGETADAAPGAQEPLLTAGDVDPEDADAFLELAAQELRAAPAFHISYTQYQDGREVGSGWSRHGPEADTAFEHHYKTGTGVRVFRYDLPEAGFMMTAQKGLSGMTLLDQPTEADRRLCSVDFVLATMDDLADTADNLELVGAEEITLPESTRGTSGSEHTTHRYTGTFSALKGGYETMTGRNTLARVVGAEFDLWVDEEGHPRRLSYTSPEGAGETFDYHAVPT